MAKTTTLTGITTSFTNTPQANDDSYVYDEDSLLLQPEIYNDALGILSLDVMSNDLGGAAKTLFSVSDGAGNPISDFSLLDKDMLTSGASAWERTTDGNWIRINNGKIDFALGTVDDVNAPSGISINSLAAGDTVDDTFVLSIRLGNGTLSEARVSVRINGNNDAATITANSGSDYDVTEAGGVANGTVGDISASGQLTVIDLDAGQSVFQEVDAGSLVGNYGSFTFDSENGVWTYTLDDTNPAVEALNTGSLPLTDSLTVTSFDGTDSETITVFINGANDAAVITGSSTVNVTETNSAVDISTSGDLNATDVDSSADFVAQTDAAGSNGYGKFSIDTTGAWTYTANNAHDEFVGGTTYTDSITVATADGTTQVLTVSILGTNDIPMISGETDGDRAVKEESDLSASGTLSIVDADAGESEFTAGAGSTTYGDYTLHANGVWTYTLNNANATVQALGEGVQITDSFVAVSKDGTANKTVTITITGTADGAVAAPAVYNGADPNDFDNIDLANVVASAVTFNGAGNTQDTVHGSNFADTIAGNNGADTIYGNGGDDTLSGGNLADTIYGGSGVDSISGGDQADLLYGGSGGDFINGNVQNDDIFGGSGNDTINGNENNDLIIGGYGADLLTGGTGPDTFSYLDVRDTGDTITDFSGLSGEGDKINLAAIDANSGTGGNDVFAFAGQTTTLSANSVIWFIHDNGTAGNAADDFRVVQLDTDGNIGTAEMEIQLTGVTPLVAGDFVL